MPDSQKDPDELTEASMRHLAGNSFHWASVGAVLMFVWGTSVLEEPIVEACCESGSDSSAEIISSQD